jgi:hypothetical protein
LFLPLKTGGMAEKFVHRGYEMEYFYSSQFLQEKLDPNDNKKLESIPSIYFTPYFDLTDPNTFTDLLLLDIDPKQKYVIFFIHCGDTTASSECLEDAQTLRKRLKTILERTINSSVQKRL